MGIIPTFRLLLLLLPHHLNHLSQTIVECIQNLPSAFSFSTATSFNTVFIGITPTFRLLQQRPHKLADALVEAVQNLRQVRLLNYLILVFIRFASAFLEFLEVEFLQLEFLQLVFLQLGVGRSHCRQLHCRQVHCRQLAEVLGEIWFDICQSQEKGEYEHSSPAIAEGTHDFEKDQLIES
jgi:hypothetical protein